jgi:hypothetical protein
MSEDVYALVNLHRRVLHCGLTMPQGGMMENLRGIMGVVAI